MIKSKREITFLPTSTYSKSLPREREKENLATYPQVPTREREIHFTCIDIQKYFLKEKEAT